MHQLFDENYSVLSRMIKQIDAHGIMFECRLSPENPYPCAHQDASDMIDYLLANQTQFKIDINKVVISGHSSGANIAAVLCYRLQNDNKLKPLHQYLLSGGFYETTHYMTLITM